MLDKLIIANLKTGTLPEIIENHEGQEFILKTCQRSLIIGQNRFDFPLSILEDSNLEFETLYAEKAYTYLLQIICGMKSKLIGENEIVGQFKLAYKGYLESPKKSSFILTILEKLFKDAKEIRSDYLIGLSQKTYSSIARKYIVKKHKGDTVLILGSGQLAEDLINQFKKNVTVYISARNQEKINILASQHNVSVVPWKDFTNYANYPFIANSIGCSKGSFIQEDFFNLWKAQHNNRLFIDLGSPSVISTALQMDDGVMRLKEIFDEGAIHEEHKKKQIARAQIALKEIVIKRKSCLNQKSRNNEIYTRT